MTALTDADIDRALMDMPAIVHESPMHMRRAVYRAGYAAGSSRTFELPSFRCSVEIAPEIAKLLSDPANWTFPDSQRSHNPMGHPMTEREKFEAWLPTASKMPIFDHRYDSHRLIAWAAWQAAIATRERAEPVRASCSTCGRVFVGDEPHINCGDFSRMSIHAPIAPDAPQQPCLCTDCSGDNHLCPIHGDAK